MFSDYQMDNEDGEYTNENTTPIPRYVKRTRKCVIYKDLSDNEGENVADNVRGSDSDFEKSECKYKDSTSSEDNRPLIAIKNKRTSSKNRTMKKCITDVVDKGIGFNNKSIKGEDKCTKNNIMKSTSFSNITRPDISEGESSESSDDDDMVPLKVFSQKLDETKNKFDDNENIDIPISLNPNFIVEKALEVSELCTEENIENNIVGTEKRKMLFSETGNGVPKKTIKLEDTEADDKKINLLSKLTKQNKSFTNVTKRKIPKEEDTFSSSTLLSEESTSDGNWEDVDGMLLFLKHICAVIKFSVVTIISLIWICVCMCVLVCVCVCVCVCVHVYAYVHVQGDQVSRLSRFVKIFLICQDFSKNVKICQVFLSFL